jgi:hypothetical protein
MATKIGLDDVLILDFWKVLKSGDYTLIGLTEDEWSDLYDAYFLQKNDSRSKQFLKSMKDEAVLVFKMHLAIENYNFLLFVVNQKPFFLNLYEQRLKEIYTLIEKTLKVKMQESQPETYNLKTIERVISALRNKYNIEQTNKAKQANKEIDNVYKVVASVSRILEMQLNVKEMTVSEWLAYEEVAKEKVQQQKQTKNGRPISKR